MTPYISRKLFLFFFTLLFVGFHLQAQDSTTVQYSKEFGIDGNFINALLPLDNNIGNRSAYLFNFRNYASDSRFNRFDFNLSLAGNFNTEEDEPNRNTNRIDWDSRFGWGYYKEVFPSGTLFWGSDIIFDAFFDQTTVGEDPNSSVDMSNARTTVTIGTGVGPFVGLQYNFTPRLGIYLEAFYQIGLNYTTNALKFDNNALDLDTRETTFRYFSAFRLPTSFVLYYKFNKKNR